MKKVVLVYPLVKLGGSVQFEYDLPLSLLSIATPLDLAGYEVKIIDQRVDPKWHEMLVRELNEDTICVGISTMTGPQINNALEVARLVRELTNIPIVWGGIHPTLRPGETLESEFVDIVVEGEGEETFYELVQALEQNKPLNTVKGVWYKKNGNIQCSGQRPFIDLNKQQTLSYHLVNVNIYFVQYFGKNQLVHETSRGCPYQCNYCYNTKVYGKNWRATSSDKVIQHLKILMKHYNAEGVAFVDDNFFVNKKRSMDILQKVKYEKLGLQFTKLDIAVTQLANFTDEDWQLAKESGCKIMTIGIESGSPRVLQMLNKEVDLEALILLNKKFKELEITPIYLFMVGYPTETYDELLMTVKLYLRLLKENPQALGRINIYTPFPGTDLFEIAVENGLKVPTCLKEWIAFNFRNTNKDAVWLTPKRKKIIRMIHFCALFHDFIHSYRKNSPLIIFLSRLYYPIARKRMEKLYYRFPIEIKLVELLGFYPKQK